MKVKELIAKLQELKDFEELEIAIPFYIEVNGINIERRLNVIDITKPDQFSNFNYRQRSPCLIIAQ